MKTPRWKQRRMSIFLGLALVAATALTGWLQIRSDKAAYEKSK